MKRNTTPWMISILISFATLTLGNSGIAFAQEASKPPASSRSSSASKPAGKERRIIILGTTIVGSVAKPRVVYEVPWKEPESLKRGLDEPQRDFHDEIFILLDKEQFESEMDQSK